MTAKPASKAAEALLAVAQGTCTMSSIRGGRDGTPGEVIQRMPESTRSLLRELKSDDIAEVANIAYFCDAPGMSPTQHLMEQFERDVLRVQTHRAKDDVRAPEPVHRDCAAHHELAAACPQCRRSR